MLARLPDKAQRLSRDRIRSIREKIVDLIKDGKEAGQPSLFWCEGMAVHGIRSSLCMQGWRWSEADAAAAEIVTGALNIAGAKRPDWYEGQPEWTQPGALPVERTRCARCRKPLPDDRRMWCSDECFQAVNADRRRSRWDEECVVQNRTWRAAWQQKQPKQECVGCEGAFKPRWHGQRYCSHECYVHTALRSR